MFCHAMPRAALFRRVSIRARTAPASIPSPPLAAPSPLPRPPGRRLSQGAYHASPRVTPALPCAQGRRAVVAGGGGTAVAEDFDLPAVLFLRQRLRYIAASDGPRTCHEMSCSVMRCHVLPPPRPSPPTSPKRRLSPSCMSSLHRVSLRSRRRRLACGASLFRGRVEDWRASFRVRWLFRRFRVGPQSGSHDYVSSPRSSNRTCGFPASGFRTRSCLRTRKAHGRSRQAHEAVFAMLPLVREVHSLPDLHLVLSTEPLA